MRCFSSLVCSFLVLFLLSTVFSEIVLSKDFEPVLVIDLSVNQVRYYDSSGKLIFSSAASGGSVWCSDVGRACKTPVGKYRISDVYGANYRSRTYPLDCVDHSVCGALMPYFMRFSSLSFGLHTGHVPRMLIDNISHGCVRIPYPAMRVLRDYLREGSLVRVLPY